MNEHRKDVYTDYEPNFIMRDADVPDETETEKNQHQEFTAASQYSDGAYKDPRENFRKTKPADKYYADSSGQNNSASSQYTYRRNSSDNPDLSGSWDSTNGYKRTRKYRRSKSKSSTPITLTKKSLSLLIILCILVSGGCGLGGAALGNRLFAEDTGPVKTGSTKATGYTLEDATGSNMTVQEITASAKSSVVEIKTESVASDSWMQQYVTEGAGSGVIITNDGYIVTNNHVIEGARKITVTTVNKKEYDATLVGTDPITDVAVLKIKANNLTPATYGNSEQLAVGDMAVAIGNPLGELGGTVTAGIISALDRQLSIDGKTMTLLQTDTSINPGNSGGGLFNGDGQLIGIVVAKSSGSDVEGLGFAIPINTAADIAQQIMDKGYVSGQPSTGMTYIEGDGKQSGGDLDLFFGSEMGSTNVYIYSVDGNNAKEAGFKEGDMVVAVDGTEITCFDDLSSIVTSHKVGDTLNFTIVRNGKEKKIKLELEERTAEKQIS